MTDNLKIGPKYNRLSPEEETAILKARNGKTTLSGATLNDILIGQSFSGGLSRDIWNNNNVDTVFVRDRLQTFFVNLFEWTGKDATEDFVLEMEKIQFRHGEVAIVKTPNGEFYPAQFTWKEEDEDFYGNPNKITIVTTNKFNGRIFNKDRFVIIRNNQGRNGTLAYAWERLRQITRSIIDVDNASLISRPKWGVNVSADDGAISDIRNAMNSDEVIVPLGNIDFTEAGIEDLSGNDLSESRINIKSHQLTWLLKMLGLQVNDGNVKAERQTELEIARNDEFDNKLIMDMFSRRKSKIDALKELGMDINLEEMEMEEPDKENVNGEINKIGEETNE